MKMPNTTYEDLAKLWKNQEECFSKWRMALTREVHQLRNEVVSKISSPDSWETHEEKETRHYIEILDLKNPDKPVPTKYISDTTTDNGELYFGLGFTFDNGVNTYPKASYHVALAIRFINNKPEFSFWDVQMKEIKGGSNWISDRQIFIDKVIQLMKNSFSFDPFDGPDRRLAIGFV